jgi:hypothetical protein
MRRLQFALFSIATLAMIASAHDTQASNTTDVTQSRYLAFFLLPGNSSGDPTLDRQIRSDIQTQLEAKGLVPVPAGEAQAVGVIHAATAAKHSRGDFYDGWGGWEWRVSGTAALDGTRNYRPGSIVVDVFDARTKQLIWTGEGPNVLSGRSGPSEPRKNALARMFRSFPVLGGNRLLPLLPIVGDHSPVEEATERIIFAQSPAVLVEVHGEPRYEQVLGTDLQRVVNTDAFIVRDEADIHYAKIGEVWMEADGLTGNWLPAGMLPSGTEAVYDDARPLGGLSTPVSESATVPVVYVVTTPTDLIVTDGEPRYGAFKGTALRYLENANAVVFQEPTDQQLYVRLPSGWFRAWTTNGPWERVADKALPADLRAVRNITRTDLNADAEQS